MADPFIELLERVKDITGLDGRASSMVAAELLDDEPDGVFSAGEIVRQARKLGFTVEEREGPGAVKTRTFAVGVSMDPPEVLSEVYMHEPRVMCREFPRLGRAPAELQEIAPELVESLPEDVRALLCKIDVFEGKATFWLYDEANDIDRPIGPIDLKPFLDSERALMDAFEALLKRLGRVLTADFN